MFLACRIKHLMPRPQLPQNSRSPPILAIQREIGNSASLSDGPSVRHWPQLQNSLVSKNPSSYTRARDHLVVHVPYLRSAISRFRGGSGSETGGIWKPHGSATTEPGWDGRTSINACGTPIGLSTTPGQVETKFQLWALSGSPIPGLEACVLRCSTLRAD